MQDLILTWNMKRKEHEMTYHQFSIRLSILVHCVTVWRTPHKVHMFHCPNFFVEFFLIYWMHSCAKDPLKFEKSCKISWCGRKFNRISFFKRISYKNFWYLVGSLIECHWQLGIFSFQRQFLWSKIEITLLKWIFLSERRKTTLVLETTRFAGAS